MFSVTTVSCVAATFVSVFVSCGCANFLRYSSTCSILTLIFGGPELSGRVSALINCQRISFACWSSSNLPSFNRRKPSSIALNCSWRNSFSSTGISLIGAFRITGNTLAISTLTISFSLPIFSCLMASCKRSYLLETCVKYSSCFCSLLNLSNVSKMSGCKIGFTFCLSKVCFKSLMTVSLFISAK